MPTVTNVPPLNVTDLTPGATQTIIVTVSAVQPPSSAAGTWEEAWSSTSKLAVARTPTMGSGDAVLPVGENNPVLLWCRVGTVVERVARIAVR